MSSTRSDQPLQLVCRGWCPSPIHRSSLPTGGSVRCFPAAADIFGVAAVRGRLDGCLEVVDATPVVWACYPCWLIASALQLLQGFDRTSGGAGASRRTITGPSTHLPGLVSLRAPAILWSGASDAWVRVVTCERECRDSWRGSEEVPWGWALTDDTIHSGAKMKAGRGQAGLWTAKGYSSPTPRRPVARWCPSRRA